MPTYPFKLVCVHPFHNYAKGQELLDPEEIAAHMEDREHHFVKVAMTDLDRAILKQMQDAAKAETDEALAKASEGAKGRDRQGRYNG